jgi:hypothetical protein
MSQNLYMTCKYQYLNPENLPCCFSKKFDKYELGTEENRIHLEEE